MHARPCLHTHARIFMHIIYIYPHMRTRRPWGHGMLGYGTVAKRYPTTFPRVMRDAGYMTCSMGKDHFGWNATSDSGIAHGYSHTVSLLLVPSCVLSVCLCVTYVYPPVCLYEYMCIPCVRLPKGSL